MAALEELCGDVSGYFYKLLEYLDQRVRDGVRRGEFTEEQAPGRPGPGPVVRLRLQPTSTTMTTTIRPPSGCPPRSRRQRRPRAASGTNRYACALMYCGRLEEARRYAETGVALDPYYPWGWLETGKLRAHFGDRAGALEAADRGLALVPGDYEFTTLRREIQEGRSLEEMEFHWIDPDCDRPSRRGEDENEAEKRLSIAGICCDPENLAAIKEALSPTEWEADAPYCTFQLPYQVRQPHRPVLPQRGGAVQAAPPLGAGSWCGGCRSWTAGAGPSWPPRRDWGRRALCSSGSRSSRTGCCGCATAGTRSSLLVLFDPDFSLRKENQPALETPGGGAFLAFVLLEAPAWDPDQFRRDLRDLYGIPCLTEAEEDGGRRQHPGL